MTRWQVQQYGEWLDPTEDQVEDAFLDEQEGTAAVTWIYGDSRYVGKAQSADGRSYSGDHWNPANRGERGQWRFDIYIAITGERLLVGKWWSSDTGGERDFLLVLQTQ